MALIMFPAPAGSTYGCVHVDFCSGLFTGSVGRTKISSRLAPPHVLSVHQCTLRAVQRPPVGSVFCSTAQRVATYPVQWLQSAERRAAAATQRKSSPK
eukprot:3291809-Rhodomonas_salina.3